MNKFRIFSVALAIAVSTLIAGTVHAAERPQFTAPQSGQTYSEIPDVRWTSPTNASEHQLFVMCNGCIKGASFLPLTYRFTVHQPYLEFSYAELKDFLRKHNITPDDRVRISIYVRSKVNGSFTRWSSPKRFYAEDNGYERSEMRTRVVVDENRMATVYGYSDRQQSSMQLSLPRSLPGNTYITCENTDYCVLRGIGPLEPGSRHHGYILNDDYMTDIIINVPSAAVTEPVSATIYPRENDDGTVTFFNYTNGRVVVDTIEIYINDRLARRCQDTTYCPFRRTTAESAKYAIRTVQNGVAYFSGYNVYEPSVSVSEQDTTKPEIDIESVEFDDLYGRVILGYSATDASGIDRIEIFEKDIKTRVCTTARCMSYSTQQYTNGESVHVEVHAYDTAGNKAVFHHYLRAKKANEPIAPVPVDVKIIETVVDGENVVILEARTENIRKVDRLNILVNAKLAKECTNTNVCRAIIKRDELSSSFTYGVNSYLNGERYWSGYKGKRL